MITYDTTAHKPVCNTSQPRATGTLSRTAATSSTGKWKHGETRQFAEPGQGTPVS